MVFQKGQKPPPRKNAPAKVAPPVPANTKKASVGAAPAGPKLATPAVSDSVLKGIEDQLTSLKGFLEGTDDKKLNKAGEKLGEALVWLNATRAKPKVAKVEEEEDEDEDPDETSDPDEDDDEDEDID